MRHLRVLYGSWAVAFFFNWLWTWKHLSIEWSQNEQYGFAWTVPFYFLFVTWRNWEGPLNPAPRTGWIVSLMAWPVFVLASLLCWHDPVWRLTGILLALSATILSTGFFLALGGKPLLLRQFWPLLFAWSGVPWPFEIESFLTQNLLLFVSTCVINLMNLIGFDAVQHGNLIQLSTGYVGVGDACSGIRSFQASIMVSLLLGEWERLNAVRRCLLLLMACLASVTVNLLRIFMLTLITQRYGEAYSARLHDTLGTAALVLIIVLLYGLFSLCRVGNQPILFPSRWPKMTVTSRWTWLLPALFILTPVAIWLFTIISTDKNHRLSAGPYWQLTPSAAEHAWQVEPYEERKAEWKPLHYSSCKAWRFRRSDTSSVFLVHLFWGPGKNVPAMAFYHTPAVCLPSVGWTLDASAVSINLGQTDSPLPFTLYQLRLEDVHVCAYQLLSSGGQVDVESASKNQSDSNQGRWSRLSLLWKEPRRQIDEEILVYVTGPIAEAQRTSELSALLGTILRKKELVSDKN